MARSREGGQQRLVRGRSEKEFRDERSGSLGVSHMHQRVVSTAAKEPTQGEVVAVAARVEDRPGVLVILDPVEAIVAPSAHPEDIVLVSSAMAKVPLQAKVTLGPVGISVGHAEEGAARWGHRCRVTPA